VQIHGPDLGRAVFLDEPLTTFERALECDVKFLEREVVRATRHRRPLAILLIDIHHFKDVNDQHGHLAGSLLSMLRRCDAGCGALVYYRADTCPPLPRAVGSAAEASAGPKGVRGAASAREAAASRAPVRTQSPFVRARTHAEDSDHGS